MKYFLMESLSLETTKSTEDVLSAIRSNVEPWTPLMTASSRTKKMTGDSHFNKFRVFRSIDHRNSFLPIVFGEVRKNSSSTLINLKVRPSVFALMALAFSIFFCFTGAVFSFFHDDNLGIAACILLGASVHSYGSWLFWKEVPETLNILKEIVI